MGMDEGFLESMGKMIAEDFAEDDRKEETAKTEGDTDADNEKHQKFLDGSLVAVRKAVQAVEKIGKYANKKQFAYTEEEVSRMFAAVQGALDDTKKLFCQKQEFSW